MIFKQSSLFKVILVIVAAFIIFVGINVAFGGIRTLGWQVAPDFVSIANESSYQIQDNHVRFLGGFFGAMGLFMLFACTNLAKYQAELRLIFIAMFVGGLSRLTALQPDVVLGSSVVSSFAAELILMPLLFFWLPRILKNEAA